MGPAAAALREALATRDAGRPAEAAERLAATAERFPVIADHAERLRIDALAAAGQDAAVLEAAEGFAARFPDAAVQPAVERTLGEARVRLGQHAAAREAFGRALAGARDQETRAALHLARGASFEEEGFGPDAAREYLRVWRDLPTTPAEPAAAEGLDRLETLAGVRVRDAAAFAARSESLYAALDNERALAATDTALRLTLPPGEREALQRRRAFLLFRLRRYPEAVEAFAPLADDEARLWRARALARSGRIEESVASFEALAGEGSSRAAQARFFAATLLEDEGEDERERARAHFAAVAEGARGSALGDDAHWRLGWAAYREGRAAVAATHFDALARSARDPGDRWKGRYWLACARAEREPEAAREALRALAAEVPLSYYGWRAAEGVAELPAVAPPRRAPTAALAGTLPARERTRVRILVAAGLLPEARAEAERLAARARGADGQLALAALYTETGQYHEAQRLVLGAEPEALAVPPDPQRPEPWWFAWPRAFEPAVAAASDGAEGVPEALVLAVMREESGYRPDAVSSVGARGLTQIMPETGARLATLRGWPAFDPARLFDPARNLELGAFYLGQLLERFDGRVSAAVAAYNAGPEAVGRWLEADGGLPDDAWVESIPYAQTHAYVKRVLRSLHAYRLLDGSAPGP